MADANSQSNNSGDGTGNGGDANNSGGDAGAQSGGEAQFDPTALSKEQIDQILEKNEHIWKADRLATLRDKGSKFDKLQTEKEEADKKALEDQGKFKELSEQQSTQITELQKTIQQMTLDQALTNKLSPLGVVNLEDALKLIDKSNINISDEGKIEGLDEAVESLKKGKAYLFNGGSSTGSNTSVGNPTNSSNGGSNGGEKPRYKASQFRGPEGQKFYQEHREDIIKANAEGRIEQD